MFLRISRTVGCVILSQMGLYCPKRKFFLEKWLRLLLSSASSCHKTSKRSLESESWDKVAWFWTKLGPNCPCPERELFFVNWLILLWSNYCTQLYYNSKFLESQSWDIIAWDIRLHNFGPNWAQITQLC